MNSTVLSGHPLQSPVPRRLPSGYEPRQVLDVPSRGAVEYIRDDGPDIVVREKFQRPLTQVEYEAGLGPVDFRLKPGERLDGRGGIIRPPNPKSSDPFRLSASLSGSDRPAPTVNEFREVKIPRAAVRGGGERDRRRLFPWRADGTLYTEAEAERAFDAMGIQLESNEARLAKRDDYFATTQDPSGFAGRFAFSQRVDDERRQLREVTQNWARIFPRTFLGRSIRYGLPSKAELVNLGHQNPGFLPALEAWLDYQDDLVDREAWTRAEKDAKELQKAKNPTNYGVNYPLQNSKLAARSVMEGTVSIAQGTVRAGGSLLDAKMPSEIALEFLGAAEKEARERVLAILEKREGERLTDLLRDPVRRAALREWHALQSESWRPDNPFGDRNLYPPGVLSRKDWAKHHYMGAEDRRREREFEKSGEIETHQELSREVSRYADRMGRQKESLKKNLPVDPVVEESTLGEVIANLGRNLPVFVAALAARNPVLVNTLGWSQNYEANYEEVFRQLRSEGHSADEARRLASSAAAWAASVEQPFEYLSDVAPVRGLRDAWKSFRANPLASWKRIKSLIKDVGKAAGRGGVIEGIVEPIQTGIEGLTYNSAVEFDKTPTEIAEEARHAAWIAFLSGNVMHGGPTLLARAFAKLPSKEQTALTELAEGRTIEEIAKVLRVRVEHVERFVNSGLRSLSADGVGRANDEANSATPNESQPPGQTTPHGTQEKHIPASLSPRSASRNGVLSVSHFDELWDKDYRAEPRRVDWVRKEVKKLAPIFKELGVTIDEVPADTAVETLDQFLIFGATTNNIFRYCPERIPQKFNQKLLHKVFEEEIIHLVWYSVLRQEHVNSKSNEDFETWIHAFSDKIIEELGRTPRGRKTIVDTFNSYRRPLADVREFANPKAALEKNRTEPFLSFNTVAELVRQLVQLRGSGTITESVIQKVYTTFQRWMEATLRRLRSLANKPSTANPILNRNVQETEAELKNLQRATNSRILVDYAR